MGELLDRLPILLEEAKEDVLYLRENTENLDKDKNGGASDVLSNVLRLFGVAEYIVNHDVGIFRKSLHEAASIKLKTIQRFDSGEMISGSLVSMLVYRSLFDALASDDFALSEKLASAMGGRDRIEEKNDHPFDKALGYALKALVLNLDNQADRVTSFKAVTNEPENKDFTGYAEGFEAIQNNDSTLFLSALHSVISGHKKQCKGSGIFKDTEDEVLCVWGLGLINLAKLRGLDVQFDNQLIPSILVS